MATWAWDIPEGQVRWNDTLYHMLGYEPGTVQPCYQAWAARVHPEDLPAAEAALRHCMAQGGDYSLEFRAVWPDATVCWIEARGRFELDAAGRPVRSYGVFWDVSERKRSELTLTATLRHLERLHHVSRLIERSLDLDRMSEAVAAWLLEDLGVDRAWFAYPCDPEAPSFRVPIEVSRPEFAGACAQNLEVPLDAVAADLMRRVLATEEPLIVDRERPLPEAPDFLRQFSIRAMMMIAVRPRVGKPWLMGLHQCSYDRVWTDEEQRLFRDIAYRLRDAFSNLLTYRELKESEEQYRATFDLATVGMAPVDLSTECFLRANAKYCEITGYSPEELRQMRPWQITHPEDRTLDRESWLRMVRGEAPEYRSEKRYIRKDGRIIWVQVNAALVRDADGRPVNTTAVVLDITRRKQAEAALRESEARFRAAFEQAAVGMVQVDLDGRLLMVNQRLCEILRYPSEELLQRTFQEVIYPPDLETELAIPQQLLAGESQSCAREQRYVRRDGSLVWVNLTVSLVRNSGGEPEYFLAVVEDIEARKLAEAELESARQQVLQAEVEKKVFNREVIRAVTRGKFHLVDAEEVPVVGQVVFETALDSSENYHRLRQELTRLCECLEMSREEVGNTVLAAGEAVSNAIKHARDGYVAIYRNGERVAIRVRDRGTGIKPEDLPATILQAGYSTKVSLGMGYTLMLEMVDRIWLATDAEGTVVQLEKWLHPTELQEEALLELLDRF